MDWGYKIGNDIKVKDGHEVTTKDNQTLTPEMGSFKVQEVSESAIRVFLNSDGLKYDGYLCKMFWITQLEFGSITKASCTNDVTKIY